MSFIDEIKRCFCQAEIPKPPCFRAVMFGDGAIYLENVCQIISYTPDEIALSLKNGGLVITGKDMYLKKYCGGDVAICGKIIKVERV